MIGGAISAKVEELIDPTRLMNRSSFGIAAASATKTYEIKILEHYFQFIKCALAFLFLVHLSTYT